MLERLGLHTDVVKTEREAPMHPHLSASEGRAVVLFMPKQPIALVAAQIPQPLTAPASSWVSSL